MSDLSKKDKYDYHDVNNFFYGDKDGDHGHVFSEDSSVQGLHW